MRRRRWSNESFLTSLRKYMEITEAGEIARRYFVLNGFDGALVTLGVIIGAIVSGSLDARFIIATGLGAAFAMGISGIFGALITERAERERVIKELEKALYTNLNNSILKRASTAAVVIIATVNAASPMIMILATLTPFFLSLYGLIPVGTALYAAVTINIAALFTLGALLGRVSDSSMVLYGALTVLAGLATIGLTLLLNVPL